MNDDEKEVLEIFQRTRALEEGHFVLRSGLHSGHYLQCARALQYLDSAERLAAFLLLRARSCGWEFTTVLAPAMGGLVIGQEFARQARARFIFAEKENNALVLRRGFSLAPDERVLIVEDVVTRGGRVFECMEIVSRAGGQVAGIAMLVDRSGGKVNFPAPTLALLQLDFPTYPADALPASLASIPIQKPGS